MAQVNSSPGQSQAAGNVAVVSTTAETGVTSAKIAAATVVVPYMQSEPGKAISTVNITRS